MATTPREPDTDRPDSPAEPVRRDYRPEGTYDKPTRFGVLRRTATEFSEDNLTDQAAALTYYGLLALFPALIALVSIVGLFADPQSTSQKLTQIVTAIGPSSGAETFKGPIESITSNQSAAGILFVIVILVALVALALVLTGPIVDAVAAPLGISSTATTVWDIAKWPVMLAIVLGIISVLYYASPN